MGVTDFTVKGKCSNCGQCCSGVLPLSRAEVERIKRYLTQNPVKEQRHNVMTGVDMTCPFRDERNRVCLIYPVRPDICVAFLCSYSPEDIQRTKMDFHENRAVVFMREEFFGNPEARKYRDAVVAEIMRMATGGAAE